MEEKKIEKISLTRLLLIFAIIVIVILSFLLYKVYSDKKESNEKIGKLYMELSNLNEKVNDVIEEKKALSEQIIKEETFLDVETGTQDVSDMKNTNSVVGNDNILQYENAEEMAKKMLNEYIKLRDYENSNIGPMAGILVELGLETEENINLLTSKINDTKTYIKSNANYEDFKERLLQYVTENYFVEKFSQYKNIDGYVGFCNCAGGTIPVEVERVTLSSVDGTEYTFNVVFKDMEVYEHYLNLEDGESITGEDYLFNKEICFEYVNDKLVISQWK